jgi:acyl dehydratase
MHADPRVAMAAGFRAPILHGLATYGIAGRALLKAYCDNEPNRMRRLDARFTIRVYPR